MKFTYFYTIFLIHLQAILKITCSADFNNLELDHLSTKLEPGECMKLLEAIFTRNPSYVVKDEKDSLEFVNQPEYCRIKLDEWNRTFQGKQNEARLAIESALRNLGRPDLANYIKRSRRLVDILNNVIHKQKSTNLERRDIKSSVEARASSSSKKRKTKKHKKSLMPPSMGHALIKAHLPPQGATRLHPYRQELKKQLVAQSNLQKEPKEIALQEFGGMKTEHVDKSLHQNNHSIEDTSATRWIAFGIFLLLILTTVLITALVAIYKHRGSFLWGSPKSAKTCDDRCPLTDHFQRISDPEHGWTSSTDYLGTRWRRASSIPTSRSPSLICLKDKKKRTRRVRQSRDKGRMEKKQKIKEGKKKKKKLGKKEATRNELSLRERIVNILRKDKGNCKCCRCPFGEDANHQVCTDDHCKERRIVNLTDLCSSSRKKSPKSLRKSKKPPKSSKSPRKLKEKEPKSSPESSPRERRDSRLKETLTRMRERSPRWSHHHYDQIEPCNRLTCDARKSPRERNSVDFDDSTLHDDEKQKK